MSAAEALPPVDPYPCPPDQEEQALQEYLDRWYGDDLGWD